MSTATADDAAFIFQRPGELLQNLLRFDTTNPPGNERACVLYIQSLLQAAGVESQILARDEGRPNLIARLKGRGSAPPMLLYGHVDVVTTANQRWTRNPFGGELVDGYIWGRGALDMKGGIAMLVAAFLRAKLEQADLPGDVLLCILSDEENGGDYGADYLVQHHPDLFAGVRHAIGEFGGFSLKVGKRRFYPIMVAEKQICWLQATFRGAGGHGSTPERGGAMAKLGRFLTRIDQHRLPVRVTPAARAMFGGMAAGLGGAQGFLLRQMLQPAWTDRILNLLGEKGALFDPLLHNSVSPTMLHASEKVNVIPSQVVLELDGRLVPGSTPDEMLADIRAVAGTEGEVEVLRFDQGPKEPDMSLFATLSAILKEADPDGIAIPLVLSGATDGRYFNRLGIQTYGFLPMWLPDDWNFSRLIHAADERIPADALPFGTDAIYKALQRFA